MPTGYTAAIKDGITFEQFAMGCARAMGALVMMRDEPANAPIPERFEPSDYNLKKLKEAQAELARLQTMTPAQADAAAESEYREAIAERAKRTKDRADLLGKYRAMLGQAQAWRAPTKDHDEFKSFMRKQIELSIDGDCDDRFDHEPTRKSGDDWLASAIGKAYQDIGYHSKAYAEELERTERCNSWLKALRESLPA